MSSFWKPEVCGQTVLPDRSFLIKQTQLRHFQWFTNTVPCTENQSKSNLEITFVPMGFAMASGLSNLINFISCGVKGPSHSNGSLL